MQTESRSLDSNMSETDGSAKGEDSSLVQVPFFRPSLRDEEFLEVLETLRSGWLTTGPKVKKFEENLAAAVGARFAVGVNSGTAALHLAVEALGLKEGQAVLVPTMTFAATAEVVRYLRGIPLLVDCDPLTNNIDLHDAARKLNKLKAGGFKANFPDCLHAVGIMPVNVGGLMVDVEEVTRFAREHHLWVVEDAAHSLLSAWRSGEATAWKRSGEHTADVTCFSFYANKTITTGEGGMAVTDNAALAERMRLMSLHGLSHDAWGRYASGGHWDYKIIAAGYKYNLTDIAASIGIRQLTRAEEMRQERERIARSYMDAFARLEEIELPREDGNRIHSWHLFAIKLRLDRLSIDRNQFIEELKRNGVGCSVHWRPLHLHPYYQETFKWKAEEFPIATAEWKRLISLPIFPGMSSGEIRHVVRTTEKICRQNAAKVSPKPT